MFLSHLGAILGHLGAILRDLGAILGHPGRILATQKPPKIAPRASKTLPKTRSNIESSWERSETKKPIKANVMSMEKNLSWLVNGKRV